MASKTFTIVALTTVIWAVVLAILTWPLGPFLVISLVAETFGYRLWDM